MEANIYTINCTGDACVGDEICFEKAIFEGNYPRSKFSHLEMVFGTIIRDSYGKRKQQPTFSLQLDQGGELLVKGRNLYRNGCYRKQWVDEIEREAIIDEKHKRGNIARKASESRILTNY